MRRRDFITLLGGATAPRPLKAWGQPATGKVTRIGYLGVASAAEGERGAKAFETGLRDLGHVPTESPSSSNIAGRMDGTNSLTFLPRSWSGCRWILLLPQLRQLP